MNFASLAESTIKQEQWDEFVLRHPSGHLFQTYEWGEVSKDLGWQPLRYLVKEGKELKAVAQLLRRSKGPISILYAPRGPLFLDKESLVFITQKLKSVVRGNNAIFLKINPALENSLGMRNWYEDAGLRRSNTREMHICTYLIDLSKDLENIWQGFSSMVKKGVKKAEREGIVIEKAQNINQVHEFYDLYKQNCVVNGIAFHSKDFVIKVWDKFSPKGNVELFLAIYRGKAIAGLLLFLYSYKCEEMWSASNVEYLNLRPYQLLHWDIFRRLKERGFVFYNMGGVPPNKSELPGIQFYKQSFGGKFTEFLGEYELAGNPILYYFWNKFGKFYINRKRIKK
ncbi:MAG: peptidoglycan bridge formation glycyltransferase FemA/FemB family protein [Candidatus Omnitrophica bacterium]|nr:peptidoglycan bridge formation glycyltransferase FemA/FemB family protein [Candidatus Omnitrophota bacterium]MBU1869146.1 peptidoglycan bridge formation glycyltransferase FemA/FemB family protein [Candidatus Omnitrophota bacterium]